MELRCLGSTLTAITDPLEQQRQGATTVIISVPSMPSDSPARRIQAEWAPTSTLYYMRQLTTKVTASKRFTQAKKCPYRGSVVPTSAETIEGNFGHLHQHAALNKIARGRHARGCIVHGL
ncbi:hypothetical protein PI126_g19990 [Phytophthora idaei]|nr:hypothetical protein PI126_g19990 [Phytophthora idaei]